MISYDQWKFAKNWMADVLCMKYKSYFGAWEKNYFLKIGSLFSNVLKFFFFFAKPGAVVYAFNVSTWKVNPGSLEVQCHLWPYSKFKASGLWLKFFFFFSQGSFGNCSEYFHSAVYSTKSSVSNFHFTLILKRGFYVACLWVWASAQTWGWSGAFPPSVSLPSILR